MPEKPIPENDPVVSKSLAPHYAISMVILMATLFWALWDEDFGQRPCRRPFALISGNYYAIRCT